MNKDNTLSKSIGGLAFATGVLLLIPFIAMQFTQEVTWTRSDFIVAGTLIFGTGLTYKLVTRKSGETAYGLAVGFALFTGFLLIWVNLAVGITGSADNPINLLYFGVIAVGLIGAFIVRFQPDGMIFTMVAMALAQALVALIVLLPHSPGRSVFETIGVNGFFITLFMVSALLFRYADRKLPIVTESTEG